MPSVWRFQSDVAPGDTDPMVTVFVGESHTNDETGEKTVPQDTSNPATVPLSELPAFLVNPVKSKPQIPEVPKESK